MAPVVVGQRAAQRLRLGHRQVQAKARSLNAALRALQTEVVTLSHGIRGHLRIAAIASATAEWLPAGLAAFSLTHPAPPAHSARQSRLRSKARP